MDAEAVATFIQQQVAEQLAAQVAAQAVAAPLAAPPAALPAHNIKPTTPPAFSGTVKEDVELWLWQVQRWFEAGRVQHELEKIALGTGLLRNAALAWWRNREQEAAVPIVWEDFAREMKANFQPINPAQTMRNQLATLRQRGTVLEYATDFRNVTLGIPGITDDEKKDRFIRGLMPRTQADVIMRDPNTFAEAVQLAVRFDTLYKTRRTNLGFHNAADTATPMELGAISETANMQTANFRQHGRLQPGNRGGSGSPRPRLRYALQQKLMKEGKCFHCQQTGHMWRQCPNRERGDRR